MGEKFEWSIPPNEESQRGMALVYFVLSKIGLVVVSVVLTTVLAYSIYRVARGESSAVSQIISACQALSFLSVTVFGYHASKSMRTAKREMLKNNEE